MNNPDPDFEIYARDRYLSLDILKNKQSTVLSYYSFVTQVAWLSWQACSKQKDRIALSKITTND